MDAQNEMVERVARALCIADGCDSDHISNDALDEGRALWTCYADAARAAIDAMREPTEAMLAASPVVGTGLDDDGKWAVNTRPAKDVWSAMIDAALK